MVAKSQDTSNFESFFGGVGGPTQIILCRKRPCRRRKYGVACRKKLLQSSTTFSTPGRTWKNAESSKKTQNTESAVSTTLCVCVCVDSCCTSVCVCVCVFGWVCRGVWMCLHWGWDQLTSRDLRYWHTGKVGGWDGEGGYLPPPQAKRERASGIRANGEFCFHTNFK